MRGAHERVADAQATPGEPTADAAISGADGNGAAPEDDEIRDGFTADAGRWGLREVEITEVTLTGTSGESGHVFQTGEPIAIHLKVQAKQPVDDFVFGVSIFNAEGVCCYGTNTYIEELEADEFHGDGEVTFAIDSLDLVEGTYKLDVAAHKREGYPYDYHRLLYTFRVKSRHKDAGIYRPRHHWKFSPAIHFKPPKAPRG